VVRCSVSVVSGSVVSGSVVSRSVVSRSVVSGSVVNGSVVSGSVVSGSVVLDCCSGSVVVECNNQEFSRGLDVIILWVVYEYENVNRGRNLGCSYTAVESELMTLMCDLSYD
jgi:hypothetical protein